MSDNAAAPNPAQLVAEFSHRLESLRHRYEQYFLGNERIEPVNQLEELTRFQRTIRLGAIHNTTFKHKLRMLNHRFTTLRSYWKRITRQIEAGTYKRDIQRAARRMRERGIDVGDARGIKSVADLGRAIEEAKQGARRSAADIRGATPKQDASQQAARTQSVDGGPTVEGAPGADDPFSGWDDALDAWSSDLGGAVSATPSASASASPKAVPAKAPPPLPRTAAARKRPATAVPSGMTRAQMDSIYRRYQKAKKICGGDPSSVKYDALVRSIERQLPKIRAAHAGKSVGFQVVIRDGKPVLKAKAE